MEQQRKIVPPVYLAFSLLLMWALQRWLPLFECSSQWSMALGDVLVFLGFAIIVWSARLFGKADTPLVPFTRSIAVVTGGPYKITRNPMYLGMVSLLMGAALLFGTLSAWIPIPFFIWVIQARFILGEEHFMEELFGEEYLSYKRTVRRWL